MNKFILHLCTAILTAMLVFASLCAFSQEPVQIELTFSTVKDGRLVSYASGTCYANDFNNDGNLSGICDVTYHDTGLVLSFAFNVNDERVIAVGPDDTMFLYNFSHRFGSTVSYGARYYTDFCTVSYK